MLCNLWALRNDAALPNLSNSKDKAIKELQNVTARRNLKTWQIFNVRGLLEDSYQIDHIFKTHRIPGNNNPLFLE